IKNLKEYFESGGPIIIHDGGERENEADLVFYAGGITPASIAMLREKAGGLICLALSSGTAKGLNLPYLKEIYSANPSTREMVLGKAPYGDESAFSISINHRDTYTGITDKDRA